MTYKALFLDLDGTTVDHFSNQPSIRIITAISKIKKKMHVCLATGRLFFQAQPVIEKLGISGYCVVANGIQIYDPRTKSICKETAIDPKDIAGTYSILKKYSANIHSFNGIDEIIYLEKDKKRKILNFYIPKIEKNKIDPLTDELNAFPQVTVHKMVINENDYAAVEICHATGTKQYGILEVAKMLGVTAAEIVGVGDGYNDFPLLLACGLKFAMGNAVPELKEIADFVTPPVDRDGVAVVIEKFLLPLLEKT